VKTITRTFILFFATHVFIHVHAQENYPQNYFRDPLSIPLQLVANFGELRPDHFHMGLDIRTQGKENLPVFAAADGYISHIKIEKNGYGKAIYIRHPDGYTTVYAHLNSFYDALERYVKTKQYKDEKWEQDFDLPARMFPVAKGQFIANSGNTGGSQGPHLHFEIRDTKTGNNLDPLLFGFYVPDNIPPVIYSLYWYDRRFSTYAVDAQPIPILKKNNAYTTGKTVKVGSPIIALGIRMEDLNNTSPFRYGVYHAALYIDDSLLFEYKLNNFSYDDDRYVNACLDYEKWIKGKQGIQYLAVLPGNQLNIFSKLESGGKILLKDTSVHKIRIEVSDEKQNTSTVNFLLRYDHSLQRNYSFPANAVVCDANEINNLETPNAKIHFDENAFYDALPLIVSETGATTSRQVSPTIHIGDNTIPVHDDYDISIKADVRLNDSLKERVVMQMQSGNAVTVANGDWQGDWMQSSFNKLGNARLLLDTIAPVITPVGWKNGTTFTGQKSLVLKCTDDLGSVVSFNATLDGNWLMFAKKNDYFTYSFDDHCAKGAHTLTVMATDVAGNVATQTFNFTKQ
jgi:hypothetical protein